MFKYRLINSIGILLLLLATNSNAQLFGAAGISTGRVNAVQALENFQRNADAFYSEGRYSQALRDYKTLSSYSDKYSQYRLATMYYDGLGVTKSLIEAYAWSFVSAESRKPEYVAFHQEIRAQLNEQQLSQAREKAGEYIAEAGLFRAAINARKLIAREKGQCTGSRLGTTCHRVTSNGISCNSDNNSTPSRRCLTMGSVGLTGVTGILPAQLRSVERNLDQFIQEYAPGRVELGDLELIDE